MMQNIWGMMGWGGGYGGYGMMGGADVITTFLVWIVLGLTIALLWKHLKK